MGGGGGESKSESRTTYTPPVQYLSESGQAAARKSTEGYLNLPTSVPIQYGGGLGTPIGTTPGIGQGGIGGMGATFQMPTRGPLYGSQMVSSMFAPVPSSQTASSYSAQAPSFSCCFNFMEAEGDISEDVRKLRDEFFIKDSDVARGYSIMARTLVPKMREDPEIKSLIRSIMTQPITKYAEWHFNKNDYGEIYQPICEAWVALWDKIGKNGGKEYTWDEFYDIVHSS